MTFPVQESMVYFQTISWCGVSQCKAVTQFVPLYRTQYYKEIYSESSTHLSSQAEIISLHFNVAMFGECRPIMKTTI